MIKMKLKDKKKALTYTLKIMKIILKNKKIEINI